MNKSSASSDSSKPNTPLIISAIGRTHHDNQSGMPARPNIVCSTSLTELKMYCILRPYSEYRTFGVSFSMHYKYVWPSDNSPRICAASTAPQKLVKFQGMVSNAGAINYIIESAITPVKTPSSEALH